MQQALWRSVASRGAVGSKSCVPNTRATASESAPYPSPCAAEMKMVSGISRFTHPASSRWERSDLLMIAIQGRPWQAVGRWFRQNQQVRDAARSNWINGVSHDIRTPLSVVMGYAAQLEEAPELTPGHKRQASAIRAKSEAKRS